MKVHPIRFPITLLLAVAISGCQARHDNMNEPESRPSSVPRCDYRGPAAKAGIVAGTLPILHVEVQVPSGGYSLRLARTEPATPGCQVLLTLESPAEGEVVAGALDVKTTRVALPTDGRPVQVRIQQIQRGLTYVQEPPFELASWLP